MPQDKEIRELLRRLGINKGKRLSNGGYQFSHDDYRFELYRSGTDYVLASNNDPPIADCWESTSGTLDELAEYLKDTAKLP